MFLVFLSASGKGSEPPTPMLAGLRPGSPSWNPFLMWWWWWCNDTPVTDSSYSRHICLPNPADALKKKKKKEIITTEGFGDEKQMEQKQKGEGSRRPISARPALPSLPWMGEGSLVGKEKTSLPIHALDSSSGKNTDFCTYRCCKAKFKNHVHVHPEQREKSERTAWISLPQHAKTVLIKFIDS